ncbi:MAG: substrate-binding domain-containing protein [Lachnospiraceae bacterium]|nr:substrate-binding domain-containing protein [Lachnospiraceae bacterium]MCD7956734.1 substrate-binding domain-containing protein [Lachnospiraceae bacterium]
MKKKIAVLLGLCMMLGCVPTVHAEETSELKIGLSMQTLNGAYFAAQEERFRELCEEKGYECITADSNGDTSTELANVENFITEGCDVIVINPVDAEASVGATLECQEAGVAVFIMDNSIDSSAYYESMIQSDNYTLGTLVGADIAAYFGNTEINMGLLSGNAGNTLGVARRTGVIAGIIEAQLESNGEASINIVTQGWGNWNQAEGQQAMEDMLTAAPEMNVIFAENDDMVLGAYEACAAIGRDDIIICGCDGNKNVYALIQDGDQVLATGRNDPYECAEMVIETIESWNSGEEISNLVYLTPVSVSDSNIDTYYDPDSTF